jgi:hypothetical protein
MDDLRYADMEEFGLSPPADLNPKSAVVQNTSDLPIYRCVVLFFDRQTGERLATRDIQVVPPHDKRRCPTPEHLWSVDPDRTIPADVVFFDAADRRWHHGYNGTLRRLPLPEDHFVSMPRR